MRRNVFAITICAGLCLLLVVSSAFAGELEKGEEANKKDYKAAHRIFQKFAGK